MNFSEEVTTPPVNPETIPEDPKPAGETPAEPAPAEPAGETPAEPAPAEPAPAEDLHKNKIDALQNSLDAALEELGKGNEPAPVEPTPAEPAKPATPVEPVKPAVPITPPVEKPKGDEAWREELKSIREGQETFQNTTMKELENMKLKDEMIGLTGEVQAAITQYPNADADRILLEIESGSDKSVAIIAKELHDGYQTLVDKISKEQEEKIKAALAIENEGKIKVPQSSGTSSTPNGAPEPGNQGATKASQDAAWADATKAAKANLQ